MRPIGCEGGGEISQRGRSVISTIALLIFALNFEQMEMIQYCFAGIV